VGAVVVTGAGGAFSAGGDMSFLHARGCDSPWRNTQVMRRFYERFLCVRKLPVPVIAAINGSAVGAGLCLALACDVRVASPTSKMGVTFVGLGLHPGMGCTHFLPLTVGPQVAARMMLTGELVGGEQALREGLIAALEDDPEQAAVAMASRMAQQAPIAVRTCVRSLRTAQVRRVGGNGGGRQRPAPLTHAPFIATTIHCLLPSSARSLRTQSAPTTSQAYSPPSPNHLVHSPPSPPRTLRSTRRFGARPTPRPTATPAPTTARAFGRSPPALDSRPHSRSMRAAPTSRPHSHGRRAREREVVGCAHRSLSDRGEGDFRWHWHIDHLSCRLVCGDPEKAARVRATAEVSTSSERIQSGPDLMYRVQPRCSLRTGLEELLTAKNGFF
jgi:hypothetical protein